MKNGRVNEINGTLNRILQAFIKKRVHPHPLHFLHHPGLLPIAGQR
jgi:hypothetical protein